MRAGVQRIFEADQLVFQRRGHLVRFLVDAPVEAVEIGLQRVVDVLRALADPLDQFPPIGLHRAVEFRKVAGDQAAEGRGVAPEPLGELAAVRLEHLLEGLEPLGQHVADEVAARTDPFDQVAAGVREHSFKGLQALRQHVAHRIGARREPVGQFGRAGGENVVEGRQALGEQVVHLIAARSEPVREFGRAAGEDAFECREAFGQHVAHAVAAHLDRLGQFGRVVGERVRVELGAAVQGFGDSLAGLLQLGDDVAAAQAEVEHDGVAGRPQSVVHLVDPTGDRLGDAARRVDERIGERIRLGEHGSGDLARARLHHLHERQRLLGQLVGDPGDPAREHLLHIVDDFDNRLVELIGLERHLFGECVGDALRQLVDAFANHLAHGEDVVRQVDMHAVDGVAHLLGFADQRLALLGDPVDEAADAHLVVVVGAFESRYLVVDQDFQLGGARDRALDAVAHRSDFAADRLADAHDRIVGYRFRLGEADDGSPHRLGDEPQFLRARHHMRQHEEEQDRRGEAHQKRDRERRGDARLREQALEFPPETECEADRGHGPGGGEQRGDDVGRARGPPLQGLQHLPDGFAIVIGGPAKGVLPARGGREGRQLVRERQMRVRLALHGFKRLGVEANIGVLLLQRLLGIAHVQRVLDRRKGGLRRVIRLFWIVRHRLLPRMLRQTGLRPCGYRGRPHCGRAVMAAMPSRKSCSMCPRGRHPNGPQGPRKPVR